VIADIIVRDGYCYVLIDERKDKKEFGCSMYKSDNLQKWIKFAEVKDLPTYPSAFEFADGSYYIAVGIGYREGEGKKASGNIYRLE
jgi:hypothetical protein